MTGWLTCWDVSLRIVTAVQSWFLHHVSFPDNKILIGPEDVNLEMDEHVMGHEEG